MLNIYLKALSDTLLWCNNTWLPGVIMSNISSNTKNMIVENYKELTRSLINEYITYYTIKGEL